MTSVGPFPPSPPGSVRGEVPLSFRIGLNAMVGLLGLQFLLGMAVNLYVAPSVLPSSLLQALGPGATSSPWMVTAHVYVGAALGVLALALLPWSLRVSPGRVFGGCVAGAVGVFVAAVAGAAYLADSRAADASYAMAVGFLVAFWAFFWTRVQGERTRGV
ncbi:MAG TPA: hypothetical protein VGV89_05360 [Thermoplasmata archaeon]|nr:hypothetical protein [Thermoplasmata archaeon]